MTALSLQNFWTALQALSEQLPFNDECVATLSVSVGTEDPTLVGKLHRRYGGRLGDDGDYVAFVSNDGVRYLQVTFVGDQDVDSEMVVRGVTGPSTGSSSALSFVNLFFWATSARPATSSGWGPK